MRISLRVPQMQFRISDLMDALALFVKATATRANICTHRLSPPRVHETQLSHSGSRRKQNFGSARSPFRCKPTSLVDRSFREAKRPGTPLPGDYATGFANVATTTDLTIHGSFPSGAWSRRRSLHSRNR